MTTTDRRDFLRLLGSTSLASMFPASIARALEIPGNHRTGTLEDVEHIVVLMQENRSFDHYFGTLRGVRGYGDPRPVRLPSGKPVWYQPDGGSYVLPFRPDANQLGLTFLEDLAHDWTSTHAAWNQGRYDQWVPNKGAASMAHLSRQDIPFHYALADAFTICDAYHCSLLGPTDPNRYYMWTGWVGNDGSGGGPVIDNAEAGYGWSTYPETLQQAGVSWKIYQDAGTGLDAAGFWGWTSDAYIGNYGDNSLLYFHQYQNAQPGNPLYDRARTGTNISAGGGLFDTLRSDVANGTLPQVSWIVAPEAYTEHPNWPANYGAWYVSQVLDALTANPEVWSKTALFVTYDENDGFFDHMVPPTVPPSASQGKSTVAITNELFAGNSSYAAGPYGLGVRVPMLVVSPWSKGGWVNSQVFDHTSIIRFIQRRFGTAKQPLDEPNISPWRRAVCGDLHSAFDFSRPDTRSVALPDTSAYQPPDRQRHPDFDAVPPATQALPQQEPGLRPARPLPYELHATAWADQSSLWIDFANTGKAGACFQVRSAETAVGPWSYTVEAGKSLADSFAAASAYDFSVHSANGFLRRFKGDLAAPRTQLRLKSRYDHARGNFELILLNRGDSPCQVTVENSYSGESFTQVLEPGERVENHWDLHGSFGWYDLIVRSNAESGFLQRLAGHVETGAPSFSDPAIAGTLQASVDA